MSTPEPEQDRTHFTMAEWSTISTELENMRRGTRKLAPVLETRNPKITPTQSQTLVDELDEIILNLVDFRSTIKSLTK